MLNNFHSTQFEVSAAKLSQCPGASVPEIVFVGRSNSGKSTAINTLCNKRQLAFASKTPGRTQLLNFFTVQYESEVIARLVDLPGYGFAQVAKSEKIEWDKELGGYLRDRISLVGCVMIVDSRRGLMAVDEALLNWIGQRNLPVHIVLSKSDKLTRQESILCRRNIEKQVASRTEKGHPVTVQLWSALNKIGLDDLELQLKRWIGHAPENAPTDTETEASEPSEPKTQP